MDLKEVRAILYDFCICLAKGLVPLYIIKRFRHSGAGYVDKQKTIIQGNNVSPEGWLVFMYFSSQFERMQRAVGSLSTRPA